MTLLWCYAVALTHSLIRAKNSPYPYWAPLACLHAYVITYTYIFKIAG